jgi:hypothetical protein
MEILPRLRNPEIILFNRKVKEREVEKTWGQEWKPTLFLFYPGLAQTWN